MALDQMGLVLCTRDRPRLLESALAAIALVVPTDVERIVVDSGSRTDEAARIADAAGARYIRSDIPGLSIARNAGLAATTREFVIFTDDDCEVQPCCAERLLAAFTSPRVAAATGTLRDIADMSSIPSDEPPRTLTSTLQGLDAGHGALMAFRVQPLRELGGFDPMLGAGRLFGGAEDLDAFCRVLHAGYEIVHVPSAVVCHVVTRTDHDFAMLNQAYGRGLGAMSCKWVRQAGGTGLGLAAKSLRRATLRLFRRLRDRRSRRGHLKFFMGFLSGFWRARRLPVRKLLFVDEHPPAPVVIASDGSRERPVA